MTHPLISASVPPVLDYSLDLSSTPSLSSRYGSGSPNDFTGPVASSGNLVWTGNSTGGGTGGTRRVYWPLSASSLRDAEIRSQWVYRNTPTGSNDAIEIQHGHAHRIINIDGTQASFLTITRNIFGGNASTGANMNIINFHWWDATTPFNQFGSVTLSRLLGPANSAVDFPWNVKSRVIDKFFEFVIWLNSDNEPHYGAVDGGGNPYGGGLEIPNTSLNFGLAGTHGVYMAHNLSGDVSAITNIKVYRL